MWLLFVPVAGRALESVKRELTFTVFSQEIALRINLPFSWKMFYFSSAAFALASTLFFLFCPHIVRAFGSFTEFLDEGRSPDYLAHVGRENPEVLRALNTYRLGGKRDSDALSDAFWTARGAADVSRKVSLRATAFAFCIGLILLAMVLIQNFIFVVNVSLR